ncbi:hypothetical protein D1007_12020 [Hordeum vulgare]|uniref:DUF6598 domain-containing protein n=1 Tax=Hordeum vulgare subsp. vulgare TaxID=112509 RepID=A0A8I6X7Q1_HORVV|nr:uncharacterized protein LOC123441059 [Hordeum vulgare subsp. vulgare]KAE8811264.1 hypothetical protein D1007_12020 [Hordeum vulgare]
MEVMEVDIEMERRKRPRIASGKAAEAEAEAAAEASASEEAAMASAAEYKKRMANPPTPEELRASEERWEKFCSESWERFRDRWIEVWSYGKIPFEAVTEIPCMRFTYTNRHPGVIIPEDTLQVVSVQVKDLTGGLQWPLDVYGVVALRDGVDRMRNVVFYRERDDCQSINEQDSYLTLTGPSRGVVMSHDNSHLEVMLKVKGTTESEDKDLNKFVDPYRLGCFLPFEYTSKLCTVEMQYYTALWSVEATIFVRVFKGRWPHGFRGVLTASTCTKRDVQISLLDLNDDELHVDADGFVKLSRCVICVEKDGKLRLSIFERGAAGEEGREIAGIWIAAEDAGEATHYMPVEALDCWMEVTVAWSLFRL